MNKVNFFDFVYVALFFIAYMLIKARVKSQTNFMIPPKDNNFVRRMIDNRINKIKGE
jgi:hypothetical protein